jgi:prolyl-tRNA synthetase
MKDAYSFDRDDEAMHRSYATMLDAYRRIFDRCGLEVLVVEADPGTIGGGTNHEFMAVADIGEDLYVSCPNGDYLADVEAARSRAPEPVATGDLEPLTEVSTPGAATIAAVTDQLGVSADRTLKCILFRAGDGVVAALAPGDREINEVKLERRLFPTPVRPFEDADFASGGYAKGFVGPQGFGEDVLVLADETVRGGANWITGANAADVHVTGANTPRDFRVDEYLDLSQIREGDPCPNDGAPLRIGRSIVVGHIYELGTRYSEPLQARFVDEDGTEQHYRMGCYGLGIERTMAAAVEQFHDDAGIRLPKVLAPFEVVVIVANRDDERVVSEADRIHSELSDLGIEVAIDDREETAGVKFADADLIGYPVQLVVGKRGVGAGTVDLKLRATGERSQAPLADAARAAVDLLASAP